MTRKDVAQVAYESFMREHGRTADDAERFAFFMGWYDGRIALRNENMAEAAADARKAYEAMVTRRAR